MLFILFWVKGEFDVSGYKKPELCHLGNTLKKILTVPTGRQSSISFRLGNVLFPEDQSKSEMPGVVDCGTILPGVLVSALPQEYRLTGACWPLFSMVQRLLRWTLDSSCLPSGKRRRRGIYAWKKLL